MVGKWALHPQAVSEGLVPLLPVGEDLRSPDIAALAWREARFGSFTFCTLKDVHEFRDSLSLPRFRQLFDEPHYISKFPDACHGILPTCWAVLRLRTIRDAIAAAMVHLPNTPHRQSKRARKRGVTLF